MQTAHGLLASSPLKELPLPPEDGQLPNLGNLACKVWSSSSIDSNLS